MTSDAPEPLAGAPARTAARRGAAPAAQASDTRRRATIALLASVGVTVALYAIPQGRYVAYPLLLVSTLAHELGHGLTAALLGASFDKLEMFSDASGIAFWSGNVGRVGRALIAAGGLCGPAVVAALAFGLGRREGSARYTLLGAGVLLLVLEVWVVRSAFGLFFAGALAALCLGVSLKAPRWVSQLVLLLLAVQLALSVFSRGDYLFTPVAELANGSRPSDVALMADALLLPYWLWGALCGAFSVVVLLLGLWVFVRGTRTIGDLVALALRRRRGRDAGAAAGGRRAPE